MHAVVDRGGPTAPPGRYRGILTALCGATAGFALGEALAGARTSEAFLVAPSVSRIGFYTLSLLLLAGLAFAFEISGPPIAARGGRAARQARAAIRRRFRHGRSRAEIAKVEAGLTLSFCLSLGALGFAFATPKAVLVIALAGALLLTVHGLLALCRLAAFAPSWCGTFGLLYGLGVGYLVA
jgi:hypothetical protein